MTNYQCKGEKSLPESTLCTIPSLHNSSFSRNTWKRWVNIILSCDDKEDDECEERREKVTNTKRGRWKAKREMRNEKRRKKKREEEYQFEGTRLNIVIGSWMELMMLDKSSPKSMATKIPLPYSISLSLSPLIFPHHLWLYFYFLSNSILFSLSTLILKHTFFPQSSKSRKNIYFLSRLEQTYTSQQQMQLLSYRFPALLFISQLWLKHCLTLGKGRKNGKSKFSLQIFSFRFISQN